jgi:transcriptional regulator with XRE-family HTH domain
MKLKDRVAIRIKTIRKLRSLTQEALAEKIERTVYAVSQLERGLSLPSFETLERLSIALEVPVRDFFDDDADGAANPRRVRLLTSLIDIAHVLSDDELDTTVGVVAAMWAKRYKED